MNLKHISAGVALALLLPFAASALSFDDIQQQIARLLAQVTQLQEQLRILQTTATTTPVVRPTPPPRCPIFERVLYRGLRGDDVTALQGYLGVAQTGFFGPVTEQAVNAIQAEAGIAQVGMVGPQTHAWISGRCGGGGWNQTFSASPTSGAAPLQVVFNARSAPGVSVSSYSVDFGDGVSEPMFNNTPQPYTSTTDLDYSSRAPVTSMGAIHTYTSNGTYTAKLIYQPPTPQCPAGMYCAQAFPPAQIVGTVTTTVGGSTSGTSIDVSSPVSGQNVSQGDTLGISWTSQNAPAGSAVALWLMKQNEHRYIKALACEPPVDGIDMCGWNNVGLIAGNQSTSGTYTWSVPVSQTSTQSVCAAGSSAYDCIKQYNVGVAYPCPQDSVGVCGARVTSGTYKIVAKLYTPADACLGGLCWPNSTPKYLASSQSGVFTIGGSSGTGGAPSITGLDAPTTLTVGQTGTWTVRLNTTNTGNLNYFVVWGDERWDMIPMGALSAAPPSIAASGTFTHAYQNAGTYSPKFTVSNSSGSAQTSATVTVGNTPVCTAMYRLCPAGTHNGGQCNQDCIPDATTTNTLSATPTSGNAPLYVNFSYPYNSSTNSGLYAVNFGDGTSGQMTTFLTAMPCLVGSKCSPQGGSWNVNHAYTSNGTYTAKLTTQGPSMCGSNGI